MTTNKHMCCHQIQFYIFEWDVYDTFIYLLCAHMFKMWMYTLMANKYWRAKKKWNEKLVTKSWILLAFFIQRCQDSDEKCPVIFRRIHTEKNLSGLFYRISLWKNGIWGETLIKLSVVNFTKNWPIQKWVSFIFKWNDTKKTYMDNYQINQIRELNTLFKCSHIEILTRISS